MLSIKVIILILVIHFLADFALQTHSQATQKSTSIKALLKHVGTYSGIWFLVAWVWWDDPMKVVLFTGFTFGFHFLTDYITSRIVKKYFDKEDYHNGFVVIGFDQVLHYMQLIVLYTLCDGMV